MRIDIKLKSGSKAEAKLRDRLLDVLKKYDLGRWQFTDKVQIQEDGSSHSHPILTLGARQLSGQSGTELLSVYLHEQSHWYLSQREEQLQNLLYELKSLYPDVPVGNPEGARDESSTYLHLIVCFLEYEDLSEIIGKMAARKVLKRHDYYRWIYRTILRDSASLGQLLQHFGLRP